MTVTVDYFTNGSYGRRSRPPVALVCIHQTSNRSGSDGRPASAQAERNYANRAGSGVTATHYIDQNGDILVALDPSRYYAWSQGVVAKPRVTVPGVPAVLAFPNPNPAYVLSIENCANARYPISEAQREAMADLIATSSLRTGLGIDRSTVHLHSDLNSVNRPNCPVPSAQREAFAADIIRRARGELAPEEDMPYEWKAERWTLDGGPGKVTTLGAPKRADGTVDYSRRLALLSGSGGADKRLDELARSRLTDPDASLTDEFYADLASYTRETSAPAQQVTITGQGITVVGP